MARAGIYRSEVKKARDALLAQGINPSIDAVRAALGHTGSKTTIHRHLRELEEEEGAGFGKKVAVSDALQDLVGRLAERLHEEAEARIVEMRTEQARQLAQRDEAVAQHKHEISVLGDQIQRLEVEVHAEREAHEQTRQALLDATVLAKQYEQQLVDLKERLDENERHRQSLEEKHQHAREALEHYRQAVKEQREQEQRRHEQQVQQLQAEVRTLDQTVIVKQHELTQLYQEVARMTAEVGALRKDLRRSEVSGEQLGRERDEQQRQLNQLETATATLTERLLQVSSARDEAWHLLRERLTLPRSEEDTLTLDLFAPGAPHDPG